MRPAGCPPGTPGGTHTPTSSSCTLFHDRAALPGGLGDGEDPSLAPDSDLCIDLGFSLQAGDPEPGGWELVFFFFFLGVGLVEQVGSGMFRGQPEHPCVQTRGSCLGLKDPFDS